MELWNPATEPFSFSRIWGRTWRQTYVVHTLQRYRWFLALGSAFLIVPNFGKLYWHYSTHHQPSVLPDFLAFILSVAARITWLFLFRDPGGFLGFRRPTKRYTWAVAGTLILTTLPNAVIHVWALKMALKNDTIVYSGIISAVLAIVFLIPPTTLAWWMAWRFMLGFDESNEDFEPVIRKDFTAEYRDNPSTPHVREGCLAEAFRSQPFESPRLTSDADSAGSAHSVEALPQQNLGRLQGEQQDVQELDTSHPRRCPTKARFEYMSQRHFGLHSWLTYPIVPLIVSISGTVALISLPILIHEDRAYQLRTPSTTLKKSLYTPLGLYLLTFYTLKHRLRASLFERFIVPPPEPWKKMLSILPSWFGTGGTFQNQETREITVYDPGRRALPWQAYKNRSLIRTRKYIQEYNADPKPCTSYWGHSSSPIRSNLRFRPTIHRIAFLSLAFYFIVIGTWNTVVYDVPNEFEEKLKHWETITGKDIARIRRILALWQGLIFSSLYWFALGFTLAVVSMASMVVLFLKAAWKYVPKEEREEVHRAAREAHEREIERLDLLEGRRLRM